MSGADWRDTVVADDGTHHRLGDVPLYAARFDEVLKFHAPGLAPVRDARGAYHIDVEGRPAYGRRFRRTFGYYEGLAAVDTGAGWCHVLPTGAAAYEARWGWCGNVQGGRCTVRDAAGRYLHIRPDGAPLYAARWRYAGDFRDGVAVVQHEHGHSTHIDEAGALTHARWFLDLDVFHKGYARARDEGGWMHVDAGGRPVYGRRFAAVEPFYNGQARVEGFDGGLEVIDEGGRTLVELRASTREPLHAVSAELVSFWRCETVFAAVDAGLFERLPVEDGIAHEAERRLLGALGELGLVRLSAGSWEGTETGSLLRADHPQSLRAAARYWSSTGRADWSRLPHALREPGWRPPDPFAAAAADPEDVAALHDALRPYAEHDYRRIGDVVEPRGLVVDAGGGSGALAVALLRARPDARAVVLERPEVVAAGRTPADLEGRLTFVAGDLFGAWPVAADTVVLARVLHDWPDDQAIALLRRARESVHPEATLYVVEMLRPAEGNRAGLLSLHLLLSTGGRERTAEELGSLLTASGWAFVETRPLGSAAAVIVARCA